MHSSDTRFYRQESGNRLYRRSLYTFWKRSAPPASLEIFNAPSRETCTVRRERTDTPLQALVTMNDVQFVEAARRLAENALRAADNNPDRSLDYISWRVIGRELNAKEREIASQSYHDYLKYYDSKPEDARKLIDTGESDADPALPPAELAAVTMLATQFLNLDEALTK
jgi:hypothetical protein